MLIRTSSTPLVKTILLAFRPPIFLPLSVISTTFLLPPNPITRHHAKLVRSGPGAFVDPSFDGWFPSLLLVRLLNSEQWVVVRFPVESRLPELEFPFFFSPVEYLALQVLCQLFRTDAQTSRFF